jgi:hypothetical protein
VSTKIARPAQDQLFRKSAPYPLRARRVYWSIFSATVLPVVLAGVLYSRGTGFSWVPWAFTGWFAVCYAVLALSEVRFCQRMDEGLHCWDCHYLVDMGFGERCSECGMNIEESRTLWAAFKPGRLWSGAAHELIQRAQTLHRSTGPEEEIGPKRPRVAGLATGFEKTNRASDEFLTTYSPHQCRVWRKYASRFTWIAFGVLVMSLVAVTALIMTSQLDLSWVTWTRLRPLLMHSSWFLVLVLFAAPEIVLKCAQLRLCHLNRKAPRCWDCSNVVDEALGDACSKCGMSIEKSRALWSFYDPLRPWIHPGSEVKWQAWKESQGEKS